jgi:hypothetical protein
LLIIYIYIEITYNLKNKTNVSFKIKKLNGLDGYPDNIQSDGSRKVKKNKILIFRARQKYCSDCHVAILKQRIKIN